MLETVWTLYATAMGHFFMALIETAMFFAQFGIAGIAALLSIFAIAIGGLVLGAK